MTRGWTLLAVAGACLALTFPFARGADVGLVRVAKGESLEDLAERVYGRRAIAGLLARSGVPERPTAGDEIAVPLARRVPLPRGSSLSRLAARHVGDGERWPVLAALSGIDDPKRCAPGAKIVIPAALEIRIRKGDSLSALADAAWGDPRGGNLLALWNGLPSGAWLRRGARLEVPLPGPFDVPKARPVPVPERQAVTPEPAGDRAGPDEERVARRLLDRRRTGRPEALLILAQRVLDAPNSSESLRDIAARHAAHALIELGRGAEARELLAEHLPAGAERDPALDSPVLAEFWP